MVVRAGHRDGRRRDAHPYLLRFPTPRAVRSVGVAVGNAVRASLVVVVVITLLTSLAIYGSDGHFNPRRVMRR